MKMYPESDLRLRFAVFELVGLILSLMSLYLLFRLKYVTRPGNDVGGKTRDSGTCCILIFIFINLEKVLVYVPQLL